MWIRSLWNRYKVWEAARCMRRSLSLRSDVFRVYLQEQSLDAALALSMRQMDRDGLLHCAKCTQRFGLKKHGGMRACAKHDEEVRREALKAVEV